MFGLVFYSEIVLTLVNRLHQTGGIKENATAVTSS